MKKLKIIPILFATAFLAGCNNINPSSSSISSPSSNSSSATSGTTASSNATSNSTTDSATSTSSSSSPSSISSSSTSSSTPTIEEGVSKYSHFQSISNKSRQAGFLPSLGNPNILVIPVDFSDYTFVEAGAKSNEAARERIEDAYYKSITNSSTQTDLIDGIIRLALKTLDSTYDYHDFDTNGDNIIDAIWLVYSGPIDNGGNSMFWAFTYWSYMEDQFDGVDVSPYAWAAYKFFDEGGYTDHPDAHTTIHETGHLMGLDDYYDYDGYRTPAGGLDMMDNNIGDHMAFNKYNLGWVKPETITESGTYTLKPLTSSTDCFIIAPKSYNDSEFWEYYIVEYYRPDGLNKLDATTKYSNLKMFTVNGLRVYHVNQKMGYLVYNQRKNSYVWNNSYISDLDSADFESEDKYPYIINSNTSSYSYNTKKDTTLVSLISAAGRTNTQDGKNSDIFTEGTSYDSKNLTWEDGESMNFSFSVTSVTDDSLTFTFTKK